MTQADYDMAQVWEQIDAINLVLAKDDNPLRRLSLRYRKAGLTQQYRRIEQDKQRERQASL